MRWWGRPGDLRVRWDNDPSSLFHRCDLWRVIKITFPTTFLKYIMSGRNFCTWRLCFSLWSACLRKHFISMMSYLKSRPRKNIRPVCMLIVFLTSCLIKMQFERSFCVSVFLWSRWNIPDRDLRRWEQIQANFPLFICIVQMLAYISQLMRQLTAV
jgi:hypothetical protein